MERTEVTAYLAGLATLPLLGLVARVCLGAGFRWITDEDMRWLEVLDGSEG